MQQHLGWQGGSGAEINRKCILSLKSFCAANKKGEKAMKQIFTGFSIIGAFALLALTAGCANIQQTENLLSEAGFRTIIMTNPQQQQLRPYKVTVAERNGETSYVYADPARKQIYVGNQSQYQRYRQLQEQVWAAQQSYTPPVCSGLVKQHYLNALGLRDRN